MSLDRFASITPDCNPWRQGFFHKDLVGGRMNDVLCRFRAK